MVQVTKRIAVRFGWDGTTPAVTVASEDEAYTLDDSSVVDTDKPYHDHVIEVTSDVAEPVDIEHRSPEASLTLPAPAAETAPALTATALVSGSAGIVTSV